jgi:hypothetical protein
MPSIVARRRTSSPRPHSRPSAPLPCQALTFWPSSVISRTPASARRSALRGSGRRAGDLGPAGIGHNAEGAELVAAFLDGEKAVATPRARMAFSGAFGSGVELVFGGKLGLDDALAVARPRQRLGQAVIGLRPDDDIDDRRAADDLLTFGLGHTAGDRDHQVAAFGIALSLELGQPAKLRIDLLGGLFADMAGVDQNEIGRLDWYRRSDSRLGSAHRPCARCHRHSSGSHRS